MSKKKIVAIIIFIIFSLFMFSYANPAEIENVEPAVGDVEVNKENLKNAIEKGNAIIEDKGTNNALLKELDDAINDGKEVYNGESTQKEVDDATKRIEDAIKAIEDDIISRSSVTLNANTLEKVESVNLTTNVVIDDPKFIAQVKFVNGTDCNNIGTILTLFNNQATVTVDENGTYTSCLYLTNGTLKQDSITVTNIDKDTEAPVISLNGKDEVKIVLGKTTYEDELAKVEDNVDEDREITGVIEGSTIEVGTYELKYNAEDTKGNKAVEVVRTIKVLDPNDDEDNDGFTNGEEVDEKTDFDDENDHPETNEPTISLNGKNPYVMLLDETYIEAGYEITVDAHDTITTKNDVVVSGAINNQTKGTYTLTYSLTDRYEKTVTTTRSIIVLEPNGDEDNDGYTNKEELDDEKDPLDENDYPEYDKRPLIIFSLDNRYEMTVYDKKPTFNATAVDVADGNVEVEITDNINPNVNGKYIVTFKAVDCLNNVSIVEKEFIVNKRKLEVTIDDKTSVFGEELKALTYILDKGIDVSGSEAGITLTKASGNDVNTYAITGSFTNDNYEVTFTDGIYTITSKDINDIEELKDIEFNGSIVTYDRESHEIKVDETLLPEGVTVSYTNNKGTSVGIYNAEATIKAKGNYKGEIVKNATLKIEAKEIELAWSNTSLTYNTNAQKPTATIKAGEVITEDTVNVTVSGEQTNVGTNYEATATIDNTNYKLKNPTTTFEIKAKSMMSTNVVWSDTNYTYNGEIQEPTATLVDGEKRITLDVAIKDNKVSRDAGNYTAIATTTNANYTLGTTEKTYTIAEKEIELVWSNTSLTYNTNAQKPTATIKAGEVITEDTVNVTVSGEQTNVGTNYEATATIDNTNYKLKNPTTTFTISKINPDIPLVPTLYGVIGNKLSTVILPMNFNYVDENEILSTAGMVRKNVIYTPTDTTNYNTVYTTVNIYVKNKYNVTFKNGEETITVVNVIEGESATAPSSPSKTGYTFKNWDKPFTNVTSNLTVNAIFEVNNYSINYILNGGTVTNPIIYTVNDTITLNNPTKTGYTFIGWSGTGITETSMNVTINKGTTGNREYTANFSANKHTITYKVDGENHQVIENVEYGTALTAIANPSKSGYTFSGWTGLPATMPDNDIEVTGTFNINTYTISYNGIENANNISDNPTTYTVNDSFTLDNPAKNNYTFTGWSGTGITGTTMNVTVSAGTTGNMTYTANWDANVTGIKVVKLQPLRFAISSAPNMSEYIEVYELKANGNEGRKLSSNEWATNVNTSYLATGKILTVTRISNNVTDSSLTYDVLTNDAYLQNTKFTVEFDASNKYTTCEGYSNNYKFNSLYEKNLQHCNRTKDYFADKNFLILTEHYVQKISNIEVTAYYIDSNNITTDKELSITNSYYSTGINGTIKYGPKYRAYLNNQDVMNDDLKYVEIQYYRQNKGTFKIIFDYDKANNRFVARIEYKLVEGHFEDWEWIPEYWVEYNQG